MCSLTGKDFFLPARNDGCLRATDAGSPRPVTYLYHKNTELIRTLFPESEEAALSSFATTQELAHPPFVVPRLTATSDLAFNVSMAKLNKFEVALPRVLDRFAKNLPFYNRREEALLNRTRDYSDQVIDKSGDVIGALGSLLSFLGDDVSRFLAIVFSTLGMAVIGTTLTLLATVPTICRHHRRARRDNKRLEKLPSPASKALV